MADPVHLEVDHLIQSFPNCCPDYTISDREFGFRAGQIDIVDRLRAAKEKAKFDINSDLS